LSNIQNLIASGSDIDSIRKYPLTCTRADPNTELKTLLHSLPCLLSVSSPTEEIEREVWNLALYNLQWFSLILSFHFDFVFLSQTNQIKSNQILLLDIPTWFWLIWFSHLITGWFLIRNPKLNVIIQN
jgi:hypothetical protein